MIGINYFILQSLQFIDDQVKIEQDTEDLEYITRIIHKKYGK